MRKKKYERNETNGVIIEKWNDGKSGIEMFFKPNYDGEKAKEMWKLLNQPLRKGE